MSFHERLERRAIAVVTDLQADMPATAANHSGNRWPIGVEGTMTTPFIGSAAGWVCIISVFAAFLAGVLVEFIGFGHIIR
jgi:hypothetical protein